MAATSITIAILAGGAATRLDGRDKGLECLHGRPLIAWVVDAVRTMDVGAASAALLSSRHGDTESIASEGAPRNDLDPVSLLIVANRHIDAYSRHATTIGDEVRGFRGPLAGIASALAFCSTSWLISVPVDCPQPPQDLASRLLQAVQADNLDAAVAQDGERRQPLFAIYRRELASSAANAVASGQGVWSWQDTVGARELDFADRCRQFHNLNTPEEFAAYADRDDA
ncbi:MAG: molybdenum cofactor guanylyltransferase [Dokdonella sp.]